MSSIKPSHGVLASAKILQRYFKHYHYDIRINALEKYIMYSLNRNEIPSTYDMIYLYDYDFIKSATLAWSSSKWGHLIFDQLIIYNNRIFLCNDNFFANPQNLSMFHEWVSSYVTLCAYCNRLDDDVTPLDCCQSDICRTCKLDLGRSKAYSCGRCGTRWLYL